MNFVLLPVVHGVELKTITNDYARPFLERVKKFLTDKEKGYLIPAPYNYTVRTHERQVKMFNAVSKGLGNERLRYLKHTVGSDVTWSFIVAKDGKKCCFRDFVVDLTNMISTYKKQYPGLKVMGLTHSQGTQYFLSFLFEFAGFIYGFISMGSPIPMNSGAYEDEDPEKDWGQLPKNLGSWHNFWHWMDFISDPMQGRHPQKNIADFVVDHEVPSAWWKILFKLPRKVSALGAAFFAHVCYWESDFVAEIVAEEIRRLMHLPPPNKP